MWRKVFPGTEGEGRYDDMQIRAGRVASRMGCVVLSYPQLNRIYGQRVTLFGVNDFHDEVKKINEKFWVSLIF